MGSKMHALGQPDELASHLRAERRRQRLSRSQLAAVSGVSPSFIRDAESDPARCSFGKLLKLVQSLGMTLLLQEAKVAS